MTKQFQNAQEKLDRAQKHAEDKRLGSQKTIERLQQEYEQMALERRDNDKQMDELRKEADDVATRVRMIPKIEFVRLSYFHCRRRSITRKVMQSYKN